MKLPKKIAALLTVTLVLGYLTPILSNVQQAVSTNLIGSERYETYYKSKPIRVEQI